MMPTNCSPAPCTQWNNQHDVKAAEEYQLMKAYALLHAQRMYRLTHDTASQEYERGSRLRPVWNGPEQRYKKRRLSGHTREKKPVNHVLLEELRRVWEERRRLRERATYWHEKVTSRVRLLDSTVKCRWNVMNY